MRRFFLSVVFLLMSTGCFMYAGTGRIVLKSSAVITGYISSQEIGRSPVVTVVSGNSTKKIRIKISEIDYIEKDTLDLFMSGLEDVVTTKSGEEIRGVIFRQILGKGIMILDSLCSTVFVDNSDILSQEKVVVSRFRTFFSGSPMLDVLTTVDGNEYEGVVIEQHFGFSNQDIYYIILLADGNRKLLRYNGLKSIGKRPNPSYDDWNGKGTIVL